MKTIVVRLLGCSYTISICTGSRHYGHETRPSRLRRGSATSRWVLGCSRSKTFGTPRATRPNGAKNTGPVPLDEGFASVRRKPVRKVTGYIYCIELKFLENLTFRLSEDKTPETGHELGP